ncbi:mRNA interferase YafQ [hydrothermal vent metagenome]|uniref:mRNA interferase YafQ n=1 Tax=hydrothermal vent metagenome TaxID=652676 RepID=A0A3B1CS28_9ZZZZ
MLKPTYTTRFEKDLKKAQKRNKDITKLKEILSKLTKEIKLDSKHRDHKLIGNFVARRECHITPDWLLIYKIDNEKIVFERLGSHSDLFK